MRSFFIFTLFLFLFFPAAAFADEGPQKIFDFAGSLNASGNYYGAALEYQRLLSYYPGSSYSEEASFMVGTAYFDAGRNDDAISAFGQFISVFPQSDRSEKALEKIAQSYYRDGKFNPGIYKMSEYKDKFKSGGLFDEADYLMGWGYLGRHDYSGAESVFYYLSSRESAYKGRSLGLATDVKQGPALPSKSPFVAGLLSAILPGSGHCYAEKYYDGLTSFILNAAFIYLASDSYRTGNSGAGLFFSVVELGWYSGGIYGGVRSANKYNEEVSKGFLNELKIKYQFNF